jgi:hypothetical protein
VRRHHRQRADDASAGLRRRGRRSSARLGAGGLRRFVLGVRARISELCATAIVEVFVLLYLFSKYRAYINLT